MSERVRAAEDGGWPLYPDERTSANVSIKSEKCQKHTNAVSVFPSLYGPIEFGDEPCQACCSPRTSFAQTLKNADPFGTRCRAGIWESGA
jgi:hypothetical protein